MSAQVTPSPAGSIRFEKVTASIGAIVHGVDVHSPHGDDVSVLLQRSLAEHGVLFFHPGTAISDEEFTAFAPLFGEPVPYPYGRGKNGNYFITEAGADAARLRTSVWHTDGSAQEKPPQAALLSSVEVPSFGGDTLWASTTAAYDALSSRYQRLLDGLEDDFFFDVFVAVDRVDDPQHFIGVHQNPIAARQGDRPPGSRKNAEVRRPPCGTRFSDGT